eukprot:scaffold37410_cov36-Phaeocystis_antarctica.AAC.1
MVRVRVGVGLGSGSGLGWVSKVIACEIDVHEGPRHTIEGEEARVRVVVEVRAARALEIRAARGISNLAEDARVPLGLTSPSRHRPAAAAAAAASQHTPGRICDHGGCGGGAGLAWVTHRLLEAW